MALTGGGAGGFANTVNPSGTGSGINYVGNHAYAYSGNVSVDDAIKTLLQFNTQNNYVMANIQMEYFDASSDNIKFVVKINDEEVCVGIITSRTDNWYNDLQVLIPPYSDVVVTGLNNSSSSARGVGVTLTGRNYA